MRFPPPTKAGPMGLSIFLPHYGFHILWFPGCRFHVISRRHPHCVYYNMELTNESATCASKDHEGQVQICNRSGYRTSNWRSRAHFTVALTWTVPDCVVAPCRGYQWESILPHVESHWRRISRCWCPVIHTEPWVTPLPPTPSSETWIRFWHQMGLGAAPPN